MKQYNPKEVEPRWQRVWDETGVYTTDLTSDKPKYIAMSMFNYPSGAGIHIGHAMNYTISDVKARFKRQQGFESYHPVGWDAFGLPAENFAIKSGISPQESMAKIIPGYHKQYKAMGWSNDWEKEIATHLPEYYKWTQWIFWKMHKEGLAYQDSRMQWWCPIDNTVLANEQVIDGKCWRHDGPDDPPVEKKEIKQWFFKITDYADELLEAIDDLDWTDSVKLAQKNWIGKSKGAEIDFEIKGHGKVTVFTTRPDTLFGATFLVLAPEHELVAKITTAEQKAAVNDYVKEAEKKSELERQTSKDKTGVFTGAYATNPINGEKLPIWIADYVLEGYGTGAIMAVPAHDERDNEFARKFDLPIVSVITSAEGKYLVVEQSISAKAAKQLTDFGSVTVESESKNWGKFWRVNVPIDKEADFRAFLETELLEKQSGGWYADSMGTTNWVIFRGKSLQINDDKDYAQFVQVGQQAGIPKEQLDIAKPAALTGEGVMMNSGEFDGQASANARENIVKKLEKEGKATEKVNYKMRDWSVSRQRYWGAPIPIINCPKDGAVLVPEEDLPIVLPELDDFQPSGDGRSALARATDWLKVQCPTCGGEAERETDTLDTYICSSWYMYRYMDPHNQAQVFDPSIVKKWEPIDFYNGADHATAHLLYARFIGHFFKKLGLVNEPEPFKQFLFNGKVTAGDGTMFSKSKGNGVDPLEIIEQGYGADALRTYLMFAAPLDTWIRWDPQGVPGTHRFLSRIWTLVQEYLEAQSKEVPKTIQRDLLRTTHSMVKKMTEDIEENRYNTAIAASMTAVNELYKLKNDHLAKNDAWQQALETVVACIAPFAPHIADELWLQLGRHTSVQRDSWPQWDEQYLVQDTITMAVQVNGKLRGEVQVAAGADQAAVEQAARANERVAVYLTGEPKKVIYVPEKLINFVI